MRISQCIWAFLLGAKAVVGCRSNNCLREIDDSHDGATIQSAHRQDCSSLLAVTITPSGATVTVTTTVASATKTVTTKTSYTTTTASTKTETTTYTLPATMAKRDISQLPSYASACKSFAAYSSACSCWGVVATTITAPIPTTTIYVVSTALPTTSQSAFVTVTVSETATSRPVKTVSPQCPAFTETFIRVMEVNCFCFFEISPGIEYVGDGYSDQYHVLTPKRCAEMCSGSTWCRHWTYFPPLQVCRLRHAAGTHHRNACAITGHKGRCNEAFCYG